MKRILLPIIIAVAGCITTSQAATFVSVTNGNWGSSATWNVTSGSDADGIPDADDDVTISSGTTVTANVNAIAHSFTVAGTFVLNNKRIITKSNFTNSGVLSGTGAFYFQGAGTLSSTTSITNPGDWYFQSPGVVIASGTTITKINYFTLSSSATVTNLGSVSLVGGSLSINAGTTWINGAGSTLLVQRNILGTGTLDASANSNTVTYSTVYNTSIKSATYYNLMIMGGGSSNVMVKSLEGPVTVNGNLTIANLVQLDANNKNITVGGNWTNTGNQNVLNSSTVTFNGSGTQVISRTSVEVFNDLQLSGSGTVLLARSIRVDGTLTLSSGTLDVSSSNFAIDMRGDWVNNGGTLNPRSGAVTFQGSAMQTMSGTGTTTFNNLTVNNSSGANISSGTYTLSNALTISAGSLNNVGGDFTLLSNPSSTARISPVPTGASISGSFTIQRYISSRNANWANLASPVQSSTIADWDAELYMSGVGGNDGNACCPIWYSVYNYAEPTASYTPVTSTGTALTNGTGFEIYLGSNTTSLSALTMDTKGTPAFGDKVIPVNRTASSPDPGWNLVGNPFASFIAWDNLQMTNLDATYYIFDNGTGTYAAYGAGTSIPPTQGFYVHSSSGSPSLTIPETAKTTSNASTFFRLGNAPDMLTLKIKGTSLPFSHKAELYLHANATPAFEGAYDALYLKSPVEEAPAIYMMSSDNNKLVKNAFSAADITVNVPVTVMAGISDIYTIETSGIENLKGEYSCIMLEDRQENKMIDLSATGSYTFELSKGTYANRFVLHLSKNGSECEKLAGKTDMNDNAVQVINSSEGLFVKFDLEESIPATISLYNVLGQEIMSTSVEAGKQTAKLDVPAGLDGIYFVNVQMSDRKVTEKVFLKKINN